MKSKLKKSIVERVGEGRGSGEQKNIFCPRKKKQKKIFGRKFCVIFSQLSVEIRIMHAHCGIF